MNLYNLFQNTAGDQVIEAYDRPFRGVGGAFYRGDDEHHEIDRAREQRDQSGTWYIRINGKILKTRDGQPYTFRGKAAANKAALTMQAKPFNAGKEFKLTTNSEDKQQGVAEGEYDSRKPFGVRYKVFAGREGRVTTREYWTSSEEKLQRAVAKIEALDNFYEIDGYSYPKESQGVAEGNLKEFAPGGGGGESGRWYTDDQLTDIVGDGWYTDLDVSGDIPKQQMIQQAQAWLDDQGYNVQVLNCKVNDDDMEWYIEGSFQNSRFAKKGMAEGSEPDAYGRTGEKHECGSCNGTGIDTYDDECPECGGKGWVRDKESLKKQGVAEGSLEEIDRRGFLKGMGAATIGGAAHASDDSAQHKLPDIIAHITIRMNGKTIEKEINLGTEHSSPMAAKQAVAKWLAEKGITNYTIRLERASVNEAPKSAAVRLGRAVQRVQGRTAASQARAIIPSSLPKPDTKPPAPVKENAEELQIGDPVIVTGPVEFEGSTGEISDFGSGKRFVVVNLYNHGRHSFHTSDISYNDYADSDEEEARAYDSDPDARNWRVAEGGLEANTPNPVVVIQDLKGKILDKVNLSVAAQKYKLGNPQDIKKQLAHQNYTTIGNYVVVAPMTGQPQDATTQGMAEGLNEFAPDGFNGGADSNDLQLYLNVAKKLNMKKYKPSTAHNLIAKKMAELVDVVDDDKVDYARHMARKAQGLPSMLDQQGVAEGSEIKIPTEDGITMQDIRLMAGDGPLTKKTILQAIAVIRKQRRPQGVAEASSSAQQAAIAIAKKKDIEEEKVRLDPKCWTGKHKEGTKIKGGVRVNNCVPNESVTEGRVKELGADLKSMTAAEFKAHYKMTKAEAMAKLKPTATTESIQVGDGFIIECGDTAIETVVLGHYHDGILIEFDHTATFMLTDAGITLTEAEYHGRTVPLGKRMAGDVKKSKVYVKKPNGKVVKVNFGDPNMRIKKSSPARRKSFRARHNCENPGPRWKARYWSCRAW